MTCGLHLLLVVWGHILVCNLVNLLTQMLGKVSDVVLVGVAVHGLASVDVHAETFSKELSDVISVVMLEVHD